MNNVINKVELKTQSLKEIFELRIDIPEYQRNYCWDEKNVIRLLDDINGLSSEYRLGTIIIQEKKNDKNEIYYDIVDGQQRLITLTILLQKLGQDECSLPLLSKSMYDEKSNDYIGYNKYLISNYIDKFKSSFVIQDIMKKLTFNVLILVDSSLDLAYTFFSNQNSRGCPLSDFDLLKAHHLRYIEEEKQAEHFANIWDSMLIKEQNEFNVLERSYERALGIYIYRLRKWLDYEDWEINANHLIKNEYEATKICDVVPAFGEQFVYKEPIQGGSHFFVFVRIFENKFLKFKDTIQYRIVHSNLIGESHGWIRDVIETFLFAYYLKFGDDYLSEILLLIIRVISNVRYENNRIDKSSVLVFAKETKIVMLIDKATSPTFIIQGLKEKIKRLPIYKEDNKHKIKSRYHNIIKSLCESDDLKNTIVLKEIVDVNE